MGFNGSLADDTFFPKASSPLFASCPSRRPLQAQGVLPAAPPLGGTLLTTRITRKIKRVEKGTENGLEIQLEFRNWG